MPRFVLLLHDCPGDKPRPTHCDLMFETGESLATWALSMLPQDWRGLMDAPQIQLALSNQVAAERLPNHRKAYLEYEGPVSGDRGSVRRLDTGTYSTASSPYEFAINGNMLRGTILLQPPTETNGTWQLSFAAASMPG